MRARSITAQAPVVPAGQAVAALAAEGVSAGPSSRRL
jgi:hypothetical protein